MREQQIDASRYARGKSERRRGVLVPDYYLPCRFLTMPMVSRCRGCGSRTVKRVKAPWLGNTVAMTVYDLRTVNARSSQPWRGQDHEDE